MSKKKQRGIFLTLDAVLAVLLLFFIIALSFSYFGTPDHSVFKSLLLRSYLQDASAIMVRQGYMASPLDSQTNSNTSGIRQVMRATPQSLCMEVSAYGTTVPDGLYGYWKLDERTGWSAADYSGYDQTGTFYGNPAFSEDGKIGQARTFDGSNDYLNITDSDNLDPGFGSFSISFWINASGTQPDTLSTILGKYGAGAYYPGYRLYINNEEGAVYACYYSGNNSCNGGQSAILSQDPRGAGYRHIAATFDRGTGHIKIYYGGTAGTSQNTSFASAQELSNAYPLYVGGDFYSGSLGSRFSGQLDDVRFYKRVLTQDDVTALYSNSWNLAYSVTKENCTYAGGNTQQISFPFVHNGNQDSNSYYTAIVKGWLRGSG